MEKQTILYGVKIGEPNYMEQIISIYPAEFTKAKKWATDNGFDRFRIAEIDLTTLPDFKKTLSDK